MADDNAGSPPRPSWHERETALALQRLANARANLATLEERAAADAAPVELDPADVARAEQLQIDIDRYTAKASGRFGGGSARAKLADSRRQLEAVLTRLGVESIADLRAAAAAPAVPAVDPAVLDFARRECAEAEKAFLDVAAMVIPEVEPDPELDAADAEVIPAPTSFGSDDGDLDLRIEPSAS